MFEPLNEYVILKEEKYVDVTQSGILIPQNDESMGMRYYKVLAVSGTGDSLISEGDHVYVHKDYCEPVNLGKWGMCVVTKASYIAVKDKTEVLQ